MGTKTACQGPPSDSARGREADQKFLSGLDKVQALPGGGGVALLHKDSVISQGPEPMARLKGRARDYKRKGQDWLGTLMLSFSLSKYHRGSVSLSQKGRGGAGCLECSLPPPSPLGPCIELILQTLWEFTGCLFQMGDEKEARKVSGGIMVSWAWKFFTKLIEG